MSNIVSTSRHIMAASRPSGTLRHGRNGTSNSPSSTTGYFSNLKANYPRGIIAFRKLMKSKNVVNSLGGVMRSKLSQPH